MKIVSYNINGIRAALGKGLADWIKATDADVICFQEIKALESQFDTEIFAELGYEHQSWFSAEKKGYSGVAILSKQQPDRVVQGIDQEIYDREGRNLRADFGDVSVMSMYLPSGTNTARLDFKFAYMDEMQRYVNEVRKERPHLIVCGDYNICHKAIDIHDPVRNKKVSGFLPEEREWLENFIQSGFIDTFRHFNEEPHQYTWWSYRANSRANNKGWRLDYAMADSRLEERLKRALILSEAKHSDHCPILLELAD
ncbi:exodeoxyribonuclease III [Aureicoccus marinus]|jgi:exodeoxyribonuclease-3|uniref:Exodeoxyribonuclease III n=1 Tax=Aureicoccus marinus TaxID=754435 RepID=A0A2S7TA46_9FLAO|nr:exodeoxyribonuclease III [Aureicoccus marinus]PQJ16387.1 exodeoxyribonuclease III [Aureicoccus marinus]